LFVRPSHSIFKLPSHLCILFVKFGIGGLCQCLNSWRGSRRSRGDISEEQKAEDKEMKNRDERKMNDSIKKGKEDTKVMKRKEIMNRKEHEEENKMYEEME